jgi:hypothetical protein
MLVVVLVGFSRSFFLRPLFPAWPSPPETIFYVHGAVFSAWCLLLVAQPRLVAAGRTDLHRAAGWWGAMLAVAMVALGTLGALVAARRPGGFVGIPVPGEQFLIVPLVDMLLFPTFVAAAIVRRHDTQAHKRLMILASVNLLAAAIARWPVISAAGPPAYFGLSDLFVVALGVWDLRTRGRLHPVTLWGGLLLIASQPLRLALSGSAAWLSVARWLTGLLG